MLKRCAGDMAGFSTFLGISIHFICLQYISGENPNSPCYDKITKKALRCEPIFSNVAYRLPIEATNTCGEKVVNDATGRPFLRNKLESFRTFYRQTGATGATKYKDRCDGKDADTTKRHPAKNMVDLDASHNKTWWQSITLYEYKERKLGDMVKATITLHLGKAFDITYINLVFHSSRPESFAIYKRTSETSEWVPYQFYSGSCRSTYSLPTDGIIDTPTRAICSSDESDITPLTGGNVLFGTLNKRPKAYEFDRNKLLQEFVTATSIQIRLTRMNTFGDEVFEDTSVLQSYYYALSDISVGGKCKCNGHANQCVRSATVDGAESVVCLCQHNTTGPDCGQCLRTHNNRPWAPATLLDPNVCQECNCNGRSQLCYFNQTLYEATGSGGFCEGCRDFTDGANCEKCRPQYFRRDARDVCSPCNCDETGSKSQQCDSSGQCPCKRGVTGAKCNRCEANYHDFGTYGCRDCGCKKDGSYENTPFCNSGTGQCSCKENVEGQDCSTCKPGYFNLNLDNKFGCIACFCNGKTSECTSAGGYMRDYINSFFDTGNEGWTAVNRHSARTSTSFNGITEDLAVSTDSSADGEVYFNATPRFLGDQKYSYNQFLEFSLRIGESQGRPSQRDVVLEGNGRSVYLPIFAQNNSVPNLKSQTYRFRLNEHPLYQWTPTLSALEFQTLLSSLTAIKIRGNYNRPGSGFIDDVRLHTAHNGQQTGDISSIERCKCPPQYLGQNCESCAPGYRRETPSGGRASECVPCECNGHSDTCDADSGACICQHDTKGHNCEKCKDGWYGNAETGTPKDCTACPCPGQGPCYQQPDLTVSCLNCPPGYSGDLCDTCEDGYYGDVDTGDNCTVCDCRGNIDTNAVGNCNSTSGVCQKCIYNTGGDHCENCLAGFYGDATTDEKGDCKACECNTNGTNRTQADVCNQTTGQCSCLKHVTGRQCDKCEEGYFNLKSTQGCEACLCDPTGSNSTRCDLGTGQCSCKDGIGGRRCDVCIADYFGFSGDGCAACECLEVGSAHGQCNAGGQCVCKDMTRITGMHCDTCHENKHNLTAGCLDCPACYNLVQDAVKDIRKSLTDLATTLQNINENPNVADDSEFTSQLNRLSKEIMDLLRRANDLKKSGGPVSDDLQEIEDNLRKLKQTADSVMKIIDDTDKKYNDINLRKLNEQIANVSDAVRQARTDFTKESSELYSRILAALGKNGPKSESQNMTSLAQRSTNVTEQQVMDSAKITDLARHSSGISSEAYNKALQALKNPEHLGEKLAQLKARITEGEQLVETVNTTAREALEKASSVYKSAIENLSEAESTHVPKIDTALRIAEAKAILELAEQQKNRTAELLAQYSSVLNDTRSTLAEAERTYNKTHGAQQVTDAMLAEVDVALQKALKAITDPDNVLALAQKQLKTLQEFDQRVKDNKEKAVEALKLIPQIEELLDRADNETLKANEAVKGAKQAANQAKKIALDAQLTAKGASENAALILAEAEKTKADALKESQVTDRHEKELQELSDKISKLEPKGEADKLLIDEVLNVAEIAKKTAKKFVGNLVAAKEKVDVVLDAVANLPELNTTELERLEAEMDRLEAEYTTANIDKQVLELKRFSDMQMKMANLHANSLTQLRADVANIEMIVNTIPQPPNCYTKQVLERGVDTTKKRRRQRKLRKQLRRRH